MFRRRNRAQSTAEYAIIISIVIGAVVAMQVFVKRGLQGRIRDATVHNDEDTGGVFTTGQYEPYYLQTTGNSTERATDTEQFQTGGSVNRSTDANTQSERNQTYGAVQND